MVDGTNGPPPAELGLTKKDLGISPDITARLNEIDSQITARFVYGKFQGPLVLHGQQLLPAGFNSRKSLDYFSVSPERKVEGNNEMDYIDASFEINRGCDPTGQFTALCQLVLRGIHPFHAHSATELERNLGASHTIGFLIDRDHPESATLMLIYPYEFFDNHFRPGVLMWVHLKLPTNQLFRLLKMVGANPDVAEQFYQVTTAGLDQSVQRYKSSQVILVDLQRFMPIENFQHDHVQLHQMVTTHPQRLNPDGMITLQYTTPHGSIDRVEVEAKRKAELQEDR